MTPRPVQRPGDEPSPAEPCPDDADRADEPDLAEGSAAGEEDPGAGLDLGDAAAPPDSTPRPRAGPDGR